MTESEIEQELVTLVGRKQSEGCSVERIITCFRSHGVTVSFSEGYLEVTADEWTKFLGAREEVLSDLTALTNKPQRVRKTPVPSAKQAEEARAEAKRAETIRLERAAKRSEMFEWTKLGVAVVGTAWGMWALFNMSDAPPPPSAEEQQAEVVRVEQLKRADELIAANMANLKATYDTAPIKQAVVNRVIAGTNTAVRVNNNSESPKIEAILRRAGWNSPTVTEGVKITTATGFTFRLEVIDGNAEDWYVGIETDSSISTGRILVKSKGSPW